MSILKPLILIFTVLFSFNFKKDTVILKTMDPVSDKNISYLALGDSYTIGESVSFSESFPAILASELKKQNILISTSKIIATTGWTTANLKSGIKNANIHGKKYDLVSLLIGVNNLYQGRSLEEYKKEFTELLLTAIDFAHGNKNKVFVISIPDYGYTPFGQSNQVKISAETDRFNAANKQITTSLGVKYFDITSISRQGLSDPSLLTTDDLHPSEKMYKQWVDFMINDVVQIINKL